MKKLSEILQAIAVRQSSLTAVSSSSDDSDSINNLQVLNSLIKWAISQKQHIITPSMFIPDIGNVDIDMVMVLYPNSLSQDSLIQDNCTITFAYDRRCNETTGGDAVILPETYRVEYRNDSHLVTSWDDNIPNRKAIKLYQASSKVSVPSPQKIQVICDLFGSPVYWVEALRTNGKAMILPFIEGMDLFNLLIVKKSILNKRVVDSTNSNWQKKQFIKAISDREVKISANNTEVMLKLPVSDSGMEYILKIIEEERDNNFSYDEVVLRIVFIILYQLEKFIHQKNMIHGDIKLENIMVKFLEYLRGDLFAAVQIVDLDYMEPPQSYTALRGTAGYVPPEIVACVRDLNKYSIDPSFDLYAYIKMALQLMHYPVLDMLIDVTIDKKQPKKQKTNIVQFNETEKNDYWLAQLLCVLKAEPLTPYAEMTRYFIDIFRNKSKRVCGQEMLIDMLCVSQELMLFVAKKVFLFDNEGDNLTNWEKFKNIMETSFRKKVFREAKRNLATQLIQTLLQDKSMELSMAMQQLCVSADVSQSVEAGPSNPFANLLATTGSSPIHRRAVITGTSETEERTMLLELK